MKSETRQSKRKSFKYFWFFQLIILLVAMVSADFIARSNEKGIWNTLRSLAFRMNVKKYVLTQKIVGSDGIPELVYPSGKRFKNPRGIARDASEYYHRVLAGEDSLKYKFIKYTNWLRDNIEEHDGWGTYTHNFAVAKYNLDSNWTSAIANGIAQVPLVYAFQMTEDSSYIDAAQLLARSYLVPIDSGGITYVLSDSSWWYEEYASTESNDPFVLNGMLSAIFGINHYYQATGDTVAARIIRWGVNAVRDSIARFDANGHSYYDFHSKKVVGDYTELQVIQLDSLYKITGDEIFGYYAKRWGDYLEKPFVVQLILSPSWRRIMLLAFVFGVIFVPVEIIFIVVYMIIRRRS